MAIARAWAAAYIRQWDAGETTVTPPPGQTCTGRLNRARQWEGRCR
jgi:hypothetical protein